MTRTSLALELADRYELVDFTLPSLERAAARLATGMELVGDHPLLCAGLGSLHWQYVNAGHDASEGRLALAREWLSKALTLEPEQPEALMGMGWMAVSRGEMAGECRYFLRALRSDPRNPAAYMGLAVATWVVGRLEEAREYSQLLLSLDPWDLYGLLCAGAVCAAAGDRGGRDRYQTLDMEVWSAPIALFIHGMLMAQDGDAEGAGERWAHSSLDNPDDLFCRFGRAGEASLRGDPRPAQALRAELAFQSLFELDAQWGWHLAEILSLAGLADEAIEALAIAVRQGFSNVLMIESCDATLAPLRSHARFPVILAEARRKADELDAALKARLP